MVSPGLSVTTSISLPGYPAARFSPAMSFCRVLSCFSYPSTSFRAFCTAVRAASESTVNSGVPAVTFWPSVTMTSVTVPAVVSVMVSLFFALVNPLPSTVEVMEPYCTVSVTICVSSVFLPPNTLMSPTTTASTTTSAIIRRIMRRRFWRGIFFHFPFTPWDVGTAFSAVSGKTGSAWDRVSFSRSLTSDIGSFSYLSIYSSPDFFFQLYESC